MKTFKEINSIRKYVSETLESAKDLSLIALENYIENVFGLSIVKSSEDVKGLLITAESKKYKGLMFEFTGETHQLDSPHGYYVREMLLTLEQVTFGDETLKVEKHYYLLDNKEKNNSEDRYFHQSFDEMKNNKLNGKDEEQEFIVKLLKTRLDEMEIEYKYSEKRNGEIQTFVIEAEGVKITFGMSNTVQFSFDKNIGSIQLIYRNLLQNSIEYELDKVLQFIKSYVEWNITLGDGKHNISKLYDGILNIVGYGGHLSSSLFTKGLNTQRLFLPFTVGNNWDEFFRQLEMSIDYDFSKQTFILNINYLFEKTKIEAETVDELLEALKQLIEITPNED